jgi:hypothetical protein
MSPVGNLHVYRTANLRMSACRSAAAVAAAVATVVVLTAGGVLALAPTAGAAAVNTGGTSTATVLRAGLDVSLLNRTVDVPVNVSLNDVRAPGDAKETALTVTVGHGVEFGRGVTMLRAAVATAKATVDRDKAEGSADLVNAQVHLPGLPLLSLVELDAISSRAICRVGHRPTASSQLAEVTVLGRTVWLKAVGTTELDVPGVGRVSLDLTNTVTTSSTAAATALRLKVRIDPLSLGVARVTGDVTLAQATCRTPQPGGSGGGSTSGGSTSGGSSGGGSGSGGASNGGSSNGGAASGGSGSGGSSGGSTHGATGGSTNGGSSNGGSSNGAASGGSSTGGSNGGATGGNSSGSSTSGGSSAGGSSSGGSSASGGSGGGSVTGPGSGNRPPTAAGSGNLAETGTSSAAPYLTAGGAALVAAGVMGCLAAARRRGLSTEDDTDPEA